MNLVKIGSNYEQLDMMTGARYAEGILVLHFCNAPQSTYSGAAAKALDQLLTNMSTEVKVEVDEAE